MDSLRIKVAAHPKETGCLFQSHLRTLIYIYIYTLYTYYIYIFDDDDDDDDDDIFMFAIVCICILYYMFILYYNNLISIYTKLYICT